MKTIAFISAIVLALSGCATSGYQQFYKPNLDPATLTDVETLPPDGVPKIFSSNDLARDIKIARSRGYLIVGSSSFNGKMEGERGVVNQAQKVGAGMVIVSSQFKETVTSTVPLFIPNNTTTYSSGSVYGNYGSAYYNGTSTTYGSTVVPITTQQQRYDQSAVYFVKSNRKLRFGVFLVDMTPEVRSKLERNTGALIDVVLEESPAFIANVMPGDVLTEINGSPVLSVKNAGELMAAVPKADRTAQFKVIRNGTERTIAIVLP